MVMWAVTRLARGEPPTLHPQGPSRLSVNSCTAWAGGCGRQMTGLSSQPRPPVARLKEEVSVGLNTGQGTWQVRLDR